MTEKVCPFCLRSPSRRGHYYMLTWKTWHDEAGMEDNEVACLDCLSDHLERPLTLSDFTAAPINVWKLGLDGGPMHAWWVKLVREGVIRMEGALSRIDDGNRLPYIRIYGGIV